MNYLQSIAQQVKAEVPSELLPDAEHLDDLFLLYALLVLEKGELTTAADVHNSWAAWMTQQDDTHDSIRPFEELAQDIQKQDEPYVDAIIKIAESLK